MIWQNLLLIALFVFLLGNNSAYAQAKNVQDSFDELQLENYLGNFSSGDLTSEDQFFRVKVYFLGREQLDKLTTHWEPWEVYPESGYLITGIFLSELSQLSEMGFTYELVDLERLLNLPEITDGIDQIHEVMDFTCYRDVRAAYEFAQQLAHDYPDLVDWIDIGDSWNKLNGLTGADMYVLNITNQRTSDPKPDLFVMSAIHAREIASAELNLRFAEYLLEQYNRDADVTWLLDSTEIHLLFYANPDGRMKIDTDQTIYEYWRKNTNQNYCTDERFWGADLNRNFSFQWNSWGGSSPNPCSDTYHGIGPASEPETQAIEAYLRSNFEDQRGNALDEPAPSDAQGVFLDLHSYGRLVLWPWGFVGAEAPNGRELKTLARKLAFYNQYEPIQAYDLYTTDGTTDDFAYGELGIAAFTFEIGSNFYEQCSVFENFLLPENLPALIYAAKAARAPYQVAAGPDVVGLVLSANNVLQGSSVTISATFDDRGYFLDADNPEPVQNIAGGSIYIGIPPWNPESDPVGLIEAVDGMFDSPSEVVEYEIDTASFAPGRYLVYVQAEDVDGNLGAVSAVFLQVNSTQVFLGPIFSNHNPVVSGSLLDLVD